MVYFPVKHLCNNSFEVQVVIMFYSEECSVRCIFSAGSKRLTEAVEHTGRTYDEIGEMIAEQVGKDEFLKCFPS